MKKGILVIILWTFLAISPSTATVADEKFENEILPVLHESGFTKYDTMSDYRPGDSISREEAAHMINKLVTVTNHEVPKNIRTCNFGDVGLIDPTLRSSIMQACRRGLVKGYSDDNEQIFLPQGILTHAEAITIIVRAIEGDKPETSDMYWLEYFNRAKVLGITEPESASDLDNIAITRKEIGSMLYKSLYVFPSATTVGETNIRTNQPIQLANVNRGFIDPIHDFNITLQSFNGDGVVKYEICNLGDPYQGDLQVRYTGSRGIVDDVLNIDCIGTENENLNPKYSCIPQSECVEKEDLLRPIDNFLIAPKKYQASALLNPNQILPESNYGNNTSEAQTVFDLYAENLIMTGHGLLTFDICSSYGISDNFRGMIDIKIENKSEGTSTERETYLQPMKSGECETHSRGSRYNEDLVQIIKEPGTYLVEVEINYSQIPQEESFGNNIVRESVTLEKPIDCPDPGTTNPVCAGDTYDTLCKARFDGQRFQRWGTC